MNPTIEARFWPKVTKGDGCWLWVGARTALGYGQFKREGRAVYAHRQSYEFVVGPIPEGFVLDHLCRTPSCVNPDHLEPVTQRVNVLRGASPMARQAAQTLCGKGLHPLSGDNLILEKGGRKRRCRECNREWDRNRRAVRKNDRLVCEQIEREEWA